MTGRVAVCETPSGHGRRLTFRSRDTKHKSPTGAPSGSWVSLDTPAAGSETNRAGLPLIERSAPAQCPRPDGATFDTTCRCYLSVLTGLVGSRPPGPGTPEI